MPNSNMITSQPETEETDQHQHPETDPCSIVNLIFFCCLFNSSRNFSENVLLNTQKMLSIHFKYIQLWILNMPDFITEINLN